MTFDAMTGITLEHPRTSVVKLGAPRHGPDYALLATVTALAIFGIVMVYSASYVIAYDARGDANYFFVRQVFWAVLGGTLLLVVDRVPYSWWARWATPGLLAGIVSLLLVQFTSLGVEFGGARRWLSLGPLPPVQPSDFVKLGVVLFLSTYLARHRERIREPRYGLLPFVTVMLVVGGLAVAERDLGTAIIILVIAAAIFLAAGADLVQLGAVALAGGSFAVVMTLTESYRWQRVITFLDPLQDMQGAGYHVAHALLALASGGLTGQGLGASREKYLYLPNAHSDSIFAVIGEELGLVGCLLVIAAFGFLVYRGYRIASRAPDALGFLLATGVTTWIAFQAFVHVAGITSVLPLTGVPLPFISSGGSSLVACLFGIGLLSNISRHRVDVVETGMMKDEGGRMKDDGRRMKGVR